MVAVAITFPSLATISNSLPVDRFTEEQHGRTFRTAKFHMKLAGWGLSLEAWPACLVEGLGRNRLNDMVLALEIPSCGDLNGDGNGSRR